MKFNDVPLNLPFRLTGSAPKGYSSLSGQVRIKEELQKEYGDKLKLSINDVLVGKPPITVMDLKAGDRFEYPDGTLYTVVGQPTCNVGLNQVFVLDCNFQLLSHTKSHEVKVIKS